MTVPANLVGPLVASLKPFIAAWGQQWNTAANYPSWSPTLSYGLPESPTRQVVVCVSTATAGGFTEITGCTVGGVNASRLAHAFDGAVATAIFIAQVPTGTSGTVAVSFNDYTTGGTVGVWSFDNAQVNIGDVKSGDAVSSLALAAAPANALFVGALARQGAYGIAGFNARVGPFQQSTAYWNALADIVPPNTGGARTLSATHNLCMCAAVFW